MPIKISDPIWVEGALVGRLTGRDCYAVYIDRDKTDVVVDSDFIMAPPYIRCQSVITEKGKYITETMTIKVVNTPYVRSSGYHLLGISVLLFVDVVVLTYDDIVVKASFDIPDGVYGTILLPPDLLIELTRDMIDRELVAELPDPRIPNPEAWEGRFVPRWRPRRPSDDVHGIKGSD